MDHDLENILALCICLNILLFMILCVLIVVVFKGRR